MSGFYCIVAAKSVVDNAVVGGNPAKVIKKREIKE
jgi:acetyltransferase-like isoleucine patch superfamily enzyme